MSAINVKAENSKTLSKMVSRIEKIKTEAVERQLLKNFLEVLVKDYLSNWLRNGNPSLTGNTFTGIAAGLYVNGSLHRTLTAMDLGVKGPTYHEASVHDYGFVDYSSNEFIGSDDDKWVVEYEHDDENIVFQRSTEGYGYMQALYFLMHHRPIVTKGYGIAVVVGSSYSAWLEKVRGLNVLTDTYAFAGPELILLADEMRFYQ